MLITESKQVRHMMLEQINEMRPFNSFRNSREACERLPERYYTEPNDRTDMNVKMTIYYSKNTDIKG